MTLYRDTIGKALREELGTVKLTDLTAGDVQGAPLAARLSSRTVQIAHNVLVRAIRQAERDDLVGRNVAALVKPPKGQGAGRPSKSLTLEQAVALMATARGTRIEAYIREPPGWSRSVADHRKMRNNARSGSHRSWRYYARSHLAASSSMSAWLRTP